MKKKLGIFLLVLLILVAGLAMAVVFGLGPIVEKAVETAVPGMTGTAVEIASVSVKPFDGHLQIKGFVLGNPEGYKTEHAISFGEFTVALDLCSVFSDTIQIHEIIIRKPEIVYDFTLRESNLGAILKNLNKVAGKSEADEESAESTSSKKVTIDHLLIEGARVVVSSKLISGVKAPIDIPTIEMKDIGKGGGVDAALALAHVFKELTKSVVVAAGELGEGLSKTVEEMGNKAIGELEDAGKALEGAARDAVRDAADDAAKALDDLLGGRKR